MNCLTRVFIFFSLIVFIIFVFMPFASASQAAPTGPVSEKYEAPSGVMPVVVLTGSPYEMGYQYGLSVPDSIAIVRDAAWASALSKNTYADIMSNCSIYRDYINSELTGFDFAGFFEGISYAMNEQGFSFTPEDPLVMLYYGGRQGPAPDEDCTAFAASGNITDGSLIAGVNFDYYHVPSNVYSVILAVYPDEGHSAIIPSGAGRTGSNAVVNDEGLVYIATSGPSQGQGDLGPGITGYLELFYVALTAGSVEDAQQFLLNSTRAFALNHLLADTSGSTEVIEASRSRYAIRYPADTANTDYIIATNHYIKTDMKPSQPVWEPLKYNPSSYYRYITAEKKLVENYGNVNYSTAIDILSLTDWWDGTDWHLNDPFSTKTINRFSPDLATLYSFIAAPNEGIVSICTGNPGITYWGTRASGQTGAYVNYTISKTPSEMVYNMKTDADEVMWNTMRIMEEQEYPDNEAVFLYKKAEEKYWEAVWWYDRSVIETDKTAQAVASGKAATGFSKVIAWSGQIQSLCKSRQE